MPEDGGLEIPELGLLTSMEFWWAELRGVACCNEM